MQALAAKRDRRANRCNVDQRQKGQRSLMTAANTAVQLERLETPETRNRLTVFFRGLLVIPQTIACLALNIAFFFVMFVGWFAALATGRLPNWAWTFSTHVVAYEARVQAYQTLLVDQYPPFAFTSPAATNYPVRLDMPEQGRLSRVKVFFRFFMLIPTSFVMLALNWGWIACGFFVWLSILITGRTPRPVLDTASAMLRYLTRVNAFCAMLTDKYPTELFGDNNPDSCQWGPGGRADPDRETP